MIAYFDTSAIVPLLIAEPNSAACRRVWSAASVTVCTLLLLVEASAAVAQAHRLGRMTTLEHGEAIDRLEAHWKDMIVIGIDESMASRASELAWTHSLRGYDAMHCAAAELMSGDEFVAVSGDRQLLTAWQSLGITTIDTNTT